MKTYLNYSQRNQNINNDLLIRKHKCKAEQKNSESIISRENKELNRPARAISFGGSAGLAKVAKKGFNKTVEFVYDNEAAYNAIYSVIVAGMLKPLFVLNMPGSEDKDKQIVATKNFLQAFIGGFLGLTIGGGFIKKAIDVVKTNLKLIKGVSEKDGKDVIEVIDATSAKALELAKEALIKAGNKKPTIDEIVEKSKAMIKNFNDNHLRSFEGNKAFLSEIKKGLGNKTTYEDAFETFWKNSTGFLTGIGKAKVSTILLPPVMAFLFAKKNAKKAEEENVKKNILLNNSSFKNEQENYKKMMDKANSNIAFRGGISNILASGIDGAATLIEKAGMSKFGEKLAKALSHTKKPSARMSDIESFLITGYWLQNTARSKKIEPSQKLGLNVHSALVTMVSSVAAFAIDWLFDGLINKSEEKYSKKLGKIVEVVRQNNKGVKENKTAGTILQDFPDAISMEIEDKIAALLKSKRDKGALVEITKDELKSLLDDITKTKTYKEAKQTKRVKFLFIDKTITKPFEFNLKNKKLVKKAVESLKASEPIRNQILDQAQDLIGSKDIAEKLSKAIWDNKAVKDEIANLTEEYGKKLSKFKSLTIFTLVVRFLVPVLMVPVSGKMKKKIAKWYEDRKAQKTQTN